MSYPPRTIYLDRCHEFTQADTLKASSPPDWTAEDEQAHARAWRRKHVSNPSTAERIATRLVRAQREANELPTAEYWQEVFGC